MKTLAKFFFGIGLFIITGVANSGVALAHDGRPIIIELTQSQTHFVDVDLKVPDAIDPRYRPTLKLPSGCNQQGDALILRQQGNYRYKTKYQCETSLGGQKISLNFPAFNPSLSTLINMTSQSGEVFTKIMPPGQTGWTVPVNASIFSVAKDYTWLGMTHIWKGLDHLLFIVCLLLVSKSRRRIIGSITGFTIAHSITLALSVLGVLTLSIGAIEALIALSIVVLAAEIIRGNKDTLVWRYPVIVAGVFGLLHGLGFASVLSDIGLPQMHKIHGLLFFNIGVEIGQILFVIAVLLSLYVFKPLISKLDDGMQSPALTRLPIYAIGLLCSVWFFERSLAVLLT